MSDAINVPEDGRPFSFYLLAEVHSIQHELSTHVDLSHDIEHMLVEKEELIGRRASDAFKHTTEIHHDEVAEDYGLEVHPYQSIFPFLHRESMLVTLYSYFEHVLNTLCDSIADEIRCRVRPRDVQGKGIERSLLFLRLVPEFKFTNIPAVMEEIRCVNLLRNVVVHAGTRLPDDPKHKLNQFVTLHPHLTGKPGSPVSLHKEFIPAFAESLKGFFAEFHEEMQRYMDRTWRQSNS
jgi:hypothetical protein